MGEQRVTKLQDTETMQRFVRALLADVQALGYMLENDWFDHSAVRIGAEQEMVMVRQMLTMKIKDMAQMTVMERLQMITPRQRQIS